MPLRDPLTRLPTEALFQDRLEQAVALARRRRGRIAVIQLAIASDDAPEEPLVELARRLEQNLRESDTVSRTNADGFTILLNDVDSHAATRAVAEELTMVAAKPLQIGERHYRFAAKYGLALFPEDGDSAAEVLRSADDALRKAQGDKSLLR